jgi:hypothetical protein
MKREEIEKWREGMEHYLGAISVEPRKGGEKPVIHAIKCVDFLLTENKRLEEQVAELEEKNLAIVRGEFNQICSYCGWESSKDAGWEELQAHIRECSKHPVNTIRNETIEECAKVTEKYRGVIYVTDAIRKLKQEDE